MNNNKEELKQILKNKGISTMEETVDNLYENEIISDRLCTVHLVGQQYYFQRKNEPQKKLIEIKTELSEKHFIALETVRKYIDIYNNLTI